MEPSNLLPLGALKRRYEVLRLPSPLIPVGENAIAFDARIGSPSSYELRILGDLNAGQLDAQLFKPT